MNKVGDLSITEKPKGTGFWGAFFLGISMKLGGLTVTWFVGLKVGFYEYFLGYLYISSTYLMLAMCMAEMVSIMSFSGGYYGYARCAMGPLIGFLVGCCGAFESVMYLSFNAIKLGILGMDSFGMDSSWQPLVWIGSYFIFISFNILFAKYFWQTMIFMGVSSLLLLAIMLFGVIGDINFNKYALESNHSGFQTGHNAGHQFSEFLDILRLSIIFFLGFDMITLTASEVKDPKINIPRVIIALFACLFFLEIWVMFTVCSLSPGVNAAFMDPEAAPPLDPGFAHLFHVSPNMVPLFVSPFVFFSGISYTYMVGKQIKSMATSGLLPHFLKQTYGKEEIPIVAMVVVSIIGFFMNYFCYEEDVYTTTAREVSIAGCFVYIAMYYCFIVFRSRYGHLERSFRSPFGIYGAYYGCFSVFIVLYVLLWYREEQLYATTLFFFVYVGVMLIYYYIYAESHQCFSASEQKVFFKAYILNMQIRKKKAIHKRFASDMMGLIYHQFGGGSSRQRYISSDRKSKSSVNNQGSSSIGSDLSGQQGSINVLSVGGESSLEAKVDLDRPIISSIN